MDQNNNNSSRWATILVYLNDVYPEEGGATVWPCVSSRDLEETRKSNPVVVAAGERLLKIHHITCTSDACHIHTNAATQEVEVEVVDGTDEASLMLEMMSSSSSSSSSSSESGLLITPVAGTAICFYSVDANGSPDPASWHGGLSLKQLDADVSNTAEQQNVGKWTLQLFATMPSTEEENLATLLQARLMK